MARPKGSENKDKPFRKALQMELAEAGENLKGLRVIARALLIKARDGEVAAIKEIADRLDGKPAQAIVGGGEDDPAVSHVHRIERVIVDAAAKDDPKDEDDSEGET